MKILVLLFIFLLLGSSVYSEKIDSKIYSDLQENSFTPIIISLNQNSVEQKSLHAVQDEIIDSLNNNDFILKYKFNHFSGFSGFVSYSGLVKLENNTKISKIISSKITGGQLLNESIISINQNILDLQINGSNKNVCVIDSGANSTHSELNGKIIAEHCFCDDSPLPGGCCPNSDWEDTNATDGTGHGTFIAGILVSNSGITKGSKIIAVRVLNNEGELVDEADVTKAIDWCNDNRNIYNISAITLSIGVSQRFSTFCDDSYISWSAEVNSAKNFGMFVGAASGNNGNKSGITSPACLENITSIASTYDYTFSRQPSSDFWSPSNCFDSNTTMNTISCFSDRASILKLLAPGSVITSTNANNSQFSQRSGTSFSVPHVTGLATLMFQASNIGNVSLNGTIVEKLMKKTGKPIFDNATGLTFPRIDAYRSVMAVLYDVFVNDLKELYSDDQGRKTFEFSIFNDYGANVTVNRTMNFGDGTSVSSSNFIIDPSKSNESLVYVDHIYSVSGFFNATVNIMSDQGIYANQTITVNVTKPNLRITNVSIINYTGLRRVVDFRLENNATAAYSGITWQMNMSGNNPINSTQNSTLGVNETIFVIVEFNYTQSGNHNITAIADYLNSHFEFNETDNVFNITDTNW